MGIFDRNTTNQTTNQYAIDPQLNQVIEGISAPSLIITDNSIPESGRGAHGAGVSFNVSQTDLGAIVAAETIAHESLLAASDAFDASLDVANESIASANDLARDSVELSEIAVTSGVEVTAEALAFAAGAFADAGDLAAEAIGATTEASVLAAESILDAQANASEFAITAFRGAGNLALISSEAQERGHADSLARVTELSDAFSRSLSDATSEALASSSAAGSRALDAALNSNAGLSRDAFALVADVIDATTIASQDAQRSAQETVSQGLALVTDSLRPDGGQTVDIVKYIAMGLVGLGVTMALFKS